MCEHKKLFQMGYKIENVVGTVLFLNLWEMKWLR